MGMGMGMGIGIGRIGLYVDVYACLYVGTWMYGLDSILGSGVVVQLGAIKRNFMFWRRTGDGGKSGDRVRAR